MAEGDRDRLERQLREHTVSLRRAPRDDRPMVDPLLRRQSPPMVGHPSWDEVQAKRIERGLRRSLAHSRTLEGRALKEMSRELNERFWGQSERRMYRVRILVERDGSQCWWCRTPYDEPHLLSLDHKVPRSKGGTNALSNLVLACPSCNSKRGNDDWQTYNAGKRAARQQQRQFPLAHS